MVFLLGAKQKFTRTEKNREVKSTDVRKSLDLGATLSGGLNIRLAPGTWLNTDLSYYLGLVNVAEEGDAKNMNLGINVGVTFPLSHTKA